MGALLEAVKKQIIQTKDPELAYLTNEISDILSECPTLDKDVKMPSAAVIIIKVDDGRKCNGKKFLIDYDSLSKFSKSNDLPPDEGYKQVLYDNDLSNEETAVLIPNLDTDNIYESIVYSPTKDLVERKKVALNEYYTTINSLQLHGISIVKSFKE